jgi:hypothetical protein
MMKFIENGKCLYTLVMPINATAECKFAVSEFVHVVKTACGEEPRVLTETEELPKKCVYIGTTLKAKELGVVPMLKETGVDGYRLAVRGEDVFIVSAGREGCIYGVYGFCI